MNNLPTIIVDTRENLPYKFKASVKCAGFEIAKLDTGDYSIKNHTDLIVIERKQNVNELKKNLGQFRQRFENELSRMQHIKFKFIIIEDYLSSIWHSKFSKMNPNSVFQSIIAFELKYGARFVFCGTREMGHKITRSLLIKAYEYRKRGIV